jgi:Sulfotransferase domain
MAERGDLTVLHEPFSNLNDYGETDADGRTFDSPATLLAWLRNETRGRGVFLKETMDHQYDEVLADRRFLAEARHAFLIRRPEEIAASYYALFPPMTINAIGMERLCEMRTAISNAGGTLPVVIDSDDLVTRPAATMAAYFATVGLPFNPRALTWERGGRPEWRRSARWHIDTSNSSGFERHKHTYLHTVENSEKLARYAAHHRPFYEQLHAQRLDVAPWERD